MHPLQDQLYNCITEGLKRQYSLGIVRQFQLLSPTIAINTTESIWQLQNQIPPFSLTWNKLVNDDLSFFQQYAQIITNQQPPNTSLEVLIGVDTYQKWTAYLKTIQPAPSDNKLPTIFSKWAMRNCPQFKNQGVSILSRLVLYNSSLKKLIPYKNGKAIDFSTIIEAIKATLRLSNNLQLEFNSGTASSDVQTTWTAGKNQQYFGIWSGSSNQTKLSQKFFNSTLTMTIKWNKWAKIDFTPSEWYDSSMLYRVYRHKKNWQPTARPNWSHYFGNDGAMKYFSFALLVVDKMSVQLTSDATYNKWEKRLIENNAFNGLWPFYSTNAINKIKFNRANNLSCTSETPSKQPIILGTFVEDIDQYLTTNI